MFAIVMKKASQFDHMIARRNCIECLASAAVVLFFGIAALQTPNALMRAGNLLIAASGLWIIFYVVRYGHEVREPAPDQSLASFQQALLR